MNGSRMRKGPIVHVKQLHGSEGLKAIDKLFSSWFVSQVGETEQVWENLERHQSPKRNQFTVKMLRLMLLLQDEEADVTECGSLDGDLRDLSLTSAHVTLCAPDKNVSSVSGRQ